MAAPRIDSPEMIGARLRAIRIAWGRLQGYAGEISQSEFARRCGIGVQAWNMAEVGGNRIGIDNAMAVVRRTGVSLDFIYYDQRNALPHALALALESVEQETPPRSARRR